MLSKNKVAGVAFVYGSARTHQLVARAATQVPITSTANDVSQNQPDGSDGWAETHIYILPFLAWRSAGMRAENSEMKPVKPAFVNDHPPPLADALVDLASLSPPWVAPGASLPGADDAWSPDASGDRRSLHSAQSYTTEAWRRCWDGLGEDAGRDATTTCEERYEVVAMEADVLELP
ncbi:hypothetical protein F4859DRAFT_508306 [Xylaria cf. heliscus]|nr:hypothetical protein F4859DRAFT_508306 [Xylaria cf. heliscus]